jgi:branched-chain amino acid transport system permease protein
MGGFLARNQTPIILIAILALIACLTFVFDERSVQTTLTEMFIRMVVVVGLYTFVGNSGVVSFGHIGFMCIGAYAAAWCTAQPAWKQIMLKGLPLVLQQNQFPMPVAILLAMVLAAAVAFLLGLAIMRLSGMAASIATFAFLMIVNSVYSNWDSVTAGVSSIIGIKKVVGPWTAFYFAAGVILVSWAFQRSRIGLMLRASRDDEAAAKASGVKIVRMRVIALTLSAALVGIGGGLYVQFLGIVTVDTFFLGLTFITIAMLVVGGMFSLTGVVVGVVVVTAIVEGLRIVERGVTVAGVPVSLPTGSQEIGLGIVLALILIFRPSGLTRSREVRLVAAAPFGTAPRAELAARPAE